MELNIPIDHRAIKYGVISAKQSVHYIQNKIGIVNENNIIIVEPL